MLRSTKDLFGYAVRAIDGEFGKVHDVYFDDQAWIVRYLVIQTGDWLMRRNVLLTTDLIGSPAPAERVLPVMLNMREIERSPGVNSDKPVSLQMRRDPYEYYMWTPYWNVPGGGAGALVISPLLVESEEQERVVEERKYDPHLRSSREVIGYHIQATDGEIGHVKDFLVDDATWTISYLVVDTRNWLPGKKVLIAPQQIKEISWAKRKVHVELSREAIKNSTGFDRQTHEVVRP